MIQVSSKLCYTAQVSFRTSFTLKNKSILRWFPGHMGKGVKQMQRKLKSVDCIVEVHDARIPLSGRNPEGFQTVSGLRPHVLVYNKRDLADQTLEPDVTSKLKSKGYNNVIFTNCKDSKCNGIKKLIPTIQKEILSSCRHNRIENKDFCLMVIGVPNVGKSSLINVLRNKYLLRGNAAEVGAKPGITKCVGEKIKISDDPLIFVFDTPGILTPKVSSVDTGMKLVLCATIPDKEIGIHLIADYLLFWLNKHQHFQYVDYFGIDRPSDDISEVLALYAINNNIMIRGTDHEGKYVMRPNLDMAAFSFVSAFRKGLFGRHTLDVDLIQSHEKERTFIKYR